MPESHTAIYGDRVTEKESGSRSSSVDALEDGDRPQPEDTMTLKSLYISDKHDTVKTLSSINGHSPQAEQTQVLPITPIPQPTSAHPYSPATLTSLIMRYEPPSPFSRWDTPLFTIPTSDGHPPYTDIWTAIFPSPLKPTSKKALSQISRQQTNASSQDSQSLAAREVDQVSQHAATQLPRATSSSALQILESTTLEIVKLVIAAAREQNTADGDGGTVLLSIPTITAGQSQKEKTLETEITIPMGTILSQPLLQRLRRKYTQIQRAAISHGRGYAGMRDGRDGIVRGFVGFLGSELEAD